MGPPQTPSAPPTGGEERSKDKLHQPQRPLCPQAMEAPLSPGHGDPSFPGHEGPLSPARTATRWVAGVSTHRDEEQSSPQAPAELRSLQTPSYSSRLPHNERLTPGHTDQDSGGRRQAADAAAQDRHPELLCAPLSPPGLKEVRGWPWTGSGGSRADSKRPQVAPQHLVRHLLLLLLPFLLFPVPKGTRGDLSQPRWRMAG